LVITLDASIVAETPADTFFKNGND